MGPQAGCQAAKGVFMIKDLRIHGEAGNGKEFFATLSGERLDCRYFHQPREKDGVFTHRFFLGGNELVLGPDTLSHTGNGGSFCPYMFGVEEPIEDLAKPDVINRLVVFGARHKAGSRIDFSPETGAAEDYRQIFLRGNAVFNYFFFLQFNEEEPLAQQQEKILRVLGRALKRFPLNLDEDDSLIVEEMRNHWSQIANAFFLLKLINRPHLEFYRKIQETYSQSLTPGDEENNRINDLAASLTIDPYSQERMKIDVMYRLPENRQVVEEYRAVLVDIRSRDEIRFEHKARLSRLRTVALRKGIPVNLLDTLDEKLFGGKKIRTDDESSYLVEVRGILGTVFLKARKTGIHLEKEDLKKLLKSKLTALENRDSAFDRLLIEVGKACDDLSRTTNDTEILEEFGNIITFFDRFDNIYNTVNSIAFHEEQKISQDKLRSLLSNRKVFDDIHEGLFHELFFAPVLDNPYLPKYGRVKVEALDKGLLGIGTGDRSLQDLMISLENIVREEHEYTIIKTAMDRWLKKFGRSLRSSEEEVAFLADVRKMLVSRGLVRPDVPESFFRRTLEDLKKERVYFGSVLPQAIQARDSGLRKEFIDSSGIDLMRIEELEREFVSQYKINEETLETIRGI
ncbi:MAG: TIGR04442 family protein [Proteobacteria bacterium]|nr:TIGR04442 family protein [Pseudomonadota bacterium]